MKKLSFLLAGLFIMSAFTVSAQKLTSGNFKMLKGEKVINLQYDYDNMAVGKFKKEQDYVTDGIADRNKKKAGSGDEWGKKWVSDRNERFEPRFETNLNDAIIKNDVMCKKDAKDAKYTLIVKTLFTEPGFNVGVMRQDAWIKMVVDVVETANPVTVLGSMEMKKLPSKNMFELDYDTGARIESCYDRAGDELGKFLNKYAFK
ncbi:MAG: hypothetical protein ACM3N9_01855 [Syntrophothermus sp.]